MGDILSMSILLLVEMIYMVKKSYWDLLLLKESSGNCNWYLCVAFGTETEMRGCLLGGLSSLIFTVNSG